MQVGQQLHASRRAAALLVLYASHARLHTEARLYTEAMYECCRPLRLGRPKCTASRGVVWARRRGVVSRIPSDEAWRRPPCTPDMPRELVSIIEGCWHPTPSKRPTFANLKVREGVGSECGLSAAPHRRPRMRAVWGLRLGLVIWARFETARGSDVAGEEY